MGIDRYELAIEPYTHAVQSLYPEQLSEERIWRATLRFMLDLLRTNTFIHLALHSF